MNFADLFRREEDPVTFAAGETIIEEGSESNTLYVILEGAVEVRYRGQVLCEETAGDIFGELSLIDRAPASASVITKTGCRLAAVTEARFQFLVQQHPFFALEVMKRMARRIRRMNELD